MSYQGILQIAFCKRFGAQAKKLEGKGVFDGQCRQTVFLRPVYQQLWIFAYTCTEI